MNGAGRFDPCAVVLGVWSGYRGCGVGIELGSLEKSTAPPNPSRKGVMMGERSEGKGGGEFEGGSVTADPIRIAFWMTSFHGGGYERNTVLIASELADRGIPTAIFVKDDIGPNREFLHPDVKAIGVSAGVLGGLGSVGELMGCAISLRRELDEWRPDAVFAHGWTCPWIATLARSRARRKWNNIVSIHNPLVPQNQDRPEWPYMRIMSRSTHAFFGVSKYIENQLINEIGIPPSKCSTIYNPIDLKWINEQKAAPIPRNFVTSAPYILSAGRIDESRQKGFIDLIDAYAILERDIVEDLVILGDGPEDEVNLLRRRIERTGLTNRVHLPGYVSNPFPIFARSRLFALASHYEGFGNVLLEALACGTQIVATDCPGGPKEILENGRYGELVPVKNPPALAEGIRKVLSRPPRVDSGIARAEQFGVDKVTDEYLDIARKPGPSHENGSMGAG